MDELTDCPSASLKQNESTMNQQDITAAAPVSSDLDVSKIQIDPQLLRHFRCPVGERDHRNPQCSTSSLASLSAVCPFGHNSENSDISLREIPAFICKRYLVSDCRHAPVTIDGLVRCADGFHPTVHQLTDGFDSYCLKVATGLWLRDKTIAQSSPPAPPLHQCHVCLAYESPTSPEMKFGYLQNCSHVFCAECILQWHERNQHRRCPVCRTPSATVLFWSHALLGAGSDEKRQLFTMQNRAIDICHMEYDEDDDDDDDYVHGDIVDSDSERSDSDDDDDEGDNNERGGGGGGRGPDDDDGRSILQMVHEGLNDIESTIESTLGELAREIQIPLESLNGLSQGLRADMQELRGAVDAFIDAADGDEDNHAAAAAADDANNDASNNDGGDSGGNVEETSKKPQESHESHQEE